MSDTLHYCFSDVFICIEPPRATCSKSPPATTNAGYTYVPLNLFCCGQSKSSTTLLTQKCCYPDEDTYRVSKEFGTGTSLTWM